ncbi:NUDIX domain-containing protein [Taibaiella lutea]|uniref:NUDIX domain-containing protein n=1 Tax=Taibaiella lutea TaxID=2608001 RepID=A0A5M6CPR6_9BACT|nr:NUDIX domain-containing protein [Taibaiella lutea]KAA5537154.1 NUDIX domain-containing protein [Taibaiella lutea]
MKNFNIRVYGLWLEDKKVLVCKENIRGKEIVKFPGGGLEFGEGTTDCLKREWMEELNAEIEISAHFYTTDFFQPSAFDNSQVISIYYTICPTHTFSIPVFNGREHFYFREIDDTLMSEISLPIDKIVAGMLFERNR